MSIGISRSGSQPPAKKPFGKLGAAPEPRRAADRVAPSPSVAVMRNDATTDRIPRGVWLTVAGVLFIGVALIGAIVMTSMRPAAAAFPPLPALDQASTRQPQRPATATREERLLNRAVNAAIEDRDVQRGIQRLNDAAATCAGNADTPFCQRALREAADDYGRSIQRSVERSVNR